MTLDTNLRKKIYEGNGVKAPFPTVFVFNKAEEVYATHVDASGAETALVRETDYSVTGGSGAAGEVEFPIDGSAYPILPEGEKIVLYRKLTLFQELDIRNFNANDLELLEQAFDRLYMILQGHEEILSRCVQIQMSSTDDPAQIVASVFQAASQAAAHALACATSEGNAIAAQEAAEFAQSLAEAARDVAIAQRDIVISEGDTQRQRVKGEGDSQVARIQLAGDLTDLVSLGHDALIQVISGVMLGKEGPWNIVYMGEFTPNTALYFQGNSSYAGDFTFLYNDTLTPSVTYGSSAHVNPDVVVYTLDDAGDPVVGYFANTASDGTGRGFGAIPKHGDIRLDFTVDGSKSYPLWIMREDTANKTSGTQTRTDIFLGGASGKLSGDPTFDSDDGWNIDMATGYGTGIISGGTFTAAQGASGFNVKLFPDDYDHGGEKFRVELDIASVTNTGMSVIEWSDADVTGYTLLVETPLTTGVNSFEFTVPGTDTADTYHPALHFTPTTGSTGSVVINSCKMYKVVEQKSIEDMEDIIGGSAPQAGYLNLAHWDGAVSQSHMLADLPPYGGATTSRAMKLSREITSWSNIQGVYVLRANGTWQEYTSNWPTGEYEYAVSGSLNIAAINTYASWSGLGYTSEADMLANSAAKVVYTHASRRVRPCAFPNDIRMLGHFVWYFNHSTTAHGAPLVYELTGTIPICTVVPAFGQGAIKTLGYYAPSETLSAAYTHSHETIALNSGGPNGVKFGYGLHDNGSTLELILVAEELVYDGAWGDDGELHIGDYAKFRFDDNGNPVVFGTWSVDLEIPST